MYGNRKRSKKGVGVGDDASSSTPPAHLVKLVKWISSLYFSHFMDITPTLTYDIKYNLIHKHTCVD
jgi:hypothetical protein